MSDYVANVETYDGPCEICGRTPEHEDARRCQLCWSIEEHLASYIETPAGRAFVIRTLGMDRIVGDLSEANRKKKNRIQHQKQHIKRLQAQITEGKRKA